LRWTCDGEKITADRPIRLSNRDQAGARLTFSDHAILPILQTCAPFLHRDPLNKRQLWAGIGIAVGCTAVLAFFIFGLPLVAKPIAKLIPVSWEEQVGDQTVDLVNKLFAGGKEACREPAGQKALEKLIGRLVSTTETSYRVKISVTDSGIVNALAAPGGRLVLFRGLIDKADTADEVAGVLAHELAHVVERHPTQGLVNAIGWSALMSVITGGSSMSSEAVAEIAARMATSAYTRDLESEADATGAAILEKAGISNAGLVQFFKKIAKMEKAGLKIPEFLSSHPLTGKRIKAIEERPHAADGPAMSAAEWRKIQNICGVADD
jgi:predicted Zn-dependent protease